MVTFNVDSLDFADDETVQQGAAPDFEWGFDSANTRLELEDLTNAATSYVPQGRSGDLVDGRLAETVAEGKALADDGVVYDSVQSAIDNASSWVKVGPGVFNESVVINTTGLVVVGSGKQTVIRYSSGSDIVNIGSNYSGLFNLTIKFFGSTDGIAGSGSPVRIENVYFTEGSTDAISPGSGLDEWTISNCTFTSGIDSRAIDANGPRWIIVNNQISGVGSTGVRTDGDDTIISGNEITDVGDNGVGLSDSDTIVIANRIDNVGGNGIRLDGGCNDCIIANNRVSDSGSSDVSDGGTGTVLDANLTGSAN